MTSLDYNAPHDPREQASGDNPTPLIRSKMGRIALDMARRGWRVFPVYPPKADGTCPCRKSDCTDAGKHPAITGWQKRATTDTAQIMGWWSEWPNYNVGIATGKESNLLVLDADGAVGRASLADSRDLPPGPAVSTGRVDGGTHYYFSCPDDFDARNFAGNIPGLDARANGGYVLAAGSLHASGKRYEVKAGSLEDPLPAPPEWLIEELKKRRAPIGTVSAKIPKGQRDDTLFSMARTMSRKGFTEHAVLEALRIENEDKCDPPLPEADLIRITQSAVSYGPDNQLVTLAYTDAGNAERFSHLWGETTRYCIEDKAWLHCDLPESYGLWVPSTDAAIHRKLVDTARRFQLTATGMPTGTAVQDEARKEALRFSLALENDRAYKAMERMAQRLLPIKREEFDTDDELLPVANGIIDLRTGELRPPNPSGFHRRHSTATYRPGYTDPVLEKFLDDTTAGIDGMRDALQVRMGYFATGHAREEELDFFVGPGGSGKSTLLEAVMTALGVDEGFGIAMDAETFMKQDVSSHGHTDDLMALEGKRLAVVQEPDGDRRMRTGLLKKLSGGDRVSGRGIYEKTRTFKNHAKLAFIFNKAPTLPANDTGFERRLWVWPFNNGRTKEQRDHSVKTHLTTSPEGQMAVLAFVAEGAKKYLALETYPIPDFIQDRTKDFWDQNDIIARFVDERCRVGQDEKTQYTTLWEEFKHWNKQEGRGLVTNGEFRDWLDKNGYVSQKIGGKTTRRGIALADGGFSWG